VNWLALIAVGFDEHRIKNPLVGVYRGVNPRAEACRRVSKTIEIALNYVDT
jgi:hypothetical protein